MRVPLQLNLKKSIAYYRPEQVREIDAQAIRRLGADGGNQLMERAGQSAFEILLQLWPGCQSVQVFCGAGNNGGDGYVLARLAKMRGLQVRVYSLADPSALRGEAADAYARAVDMDVDVLAWSDAVTLDADVLVDALLGTGLAGEVHGAYRDAITRLNDSRHPVLALDIPSGLCAVTGKALGLAVRADATLCFIAPKSGLLTGEAACFCGSIWLDDLDCSVDSRAFEPAGHLISFYSVLPLLKPRPPNAHKGLFGRVLIVGGDYGFGGAAILAAGSALKAGAGAVTCATRDAHVKPGLSCFPDIMFRSTESRELLIDLLNHCDVVAAGPGLGRSPWSEMCLQTVLDSGKPLVLDADALNMLGRTGWKNPHRVSLVITPHPGEASRMLDLSIDQVNADRYMVALRLADRLRGVCLLKGAGTVISGCRSADGSRESRTSVLRGGNPGMATAGMGDVLTGVIAGLLGQGLGAFSAACLGAAWHAASADVSVAHTGEASLMASDVMGALGETLLRVSKAQADWSDGV